VKKIEHLTEQERKEYQQKLITSQPFTLKEWKVFQEEVNKLRGTKIKKPKYVVISERLGVLNIISPRSHLLTSILLKHFQCSSRGIIFKNDDKVTMN
jgi:hypothetical protein